MYEAYYHKQEIGNVYAVYVFMDYFFFMFDFYYTNTLLIIFLIYIILYHAINYGRDLSYYIKEIKIVFDKFR